MSEYSEGIMADGAAILCDGQPMRISEIVAALNAGARAQQQVADWEEVNDDKKRLVREIDVLLNGDNAAKQASLCDIVAQLRQRLAAQPAAVEQDGCEIVYRWLALDNTGYVYGSNPPSLLPKDACLKAFYSQEQHAIDALHEIAGMKNVTATWKQYAEFLQRTAREALAAPPAQARPTLNDCIEAIRVVQRDYDRQYGGGPNVPGSVCSDCIGAIKEAFSKATEAEAPPVVPDEWRAAVSLAYGHLWHVNNDPLAPIMKYSPEKAAYAARRLLRDLLTHNERGEAINAVGHDIGVYERDAAPAAQEQEKEHG